MDHYEVCLAYYRAFQAKDTMRNVSAITAVTKVFHEAMMKRYHKSSPTQQNGIENKGTLWQNHDASIGAAAVGEKACLRTKQQGSLKKSGLQPQLFLSYACLKASIGQQKTPLNQRFIKFHSNFMQSFKVDLKTFWAWLNLTNGALLSQSKYLAGFWGPETPNLHDPYIQYQRTV